MTADVMVAMFPKPSQLILSTFNELAVLHSGTKEEKEDLLGSTPADVLPRPWDPASCPPRLRAALWVWLDAVAAWINHEYCWQPDRSIPACWTQHPHLAHELAVVASLRHQAGEALTPDPLEEWHRYALPAFLERMAAKIGPTACRAEKHAAWPARGRHNIFESTEMVRNRMASISADTTLGVTERGGGVGPPPPTSNG